MKSEIVNIDEIHEAIIAFARGEFDKRLVISEDQNERDSIIAGINMLGEELEERTISRDYFLNIYNAVSEILFVTDMYGHITNANMSAMQKLGYKIDALQKISIGELFSDGANRLEELIFNTLESQKKYLDFEIHINAKDGKVIPISGLVSKIYNSQDIQTGFLFTMRDITDKKQKQKEILKAVITTEEKERKRIAFDLHDSLGQELSAIKVYMNSLKADDENFSYRLAECKNMIDQSIQNIQKLSFNLMPKALETGNLIFAVEELGKRIDAEINFKMTCNKRDLHISKNNQLIIFRVIQEFISNTLKHAKANNLTIHFNNANRKTNIEIIDDGVGFKMKNVQTTNGRGLHNIETRLKALLIDYSFQSTPKGTSLKLTIDNEKN